MGNIDTAMAQDHSYTYEGNALLPWIVCFSAALFFFYEFIQMNMFNAISSQLMAAFSLNATQLGKLSANYFYATVLFLLPAGLILDRFSTRKIILISLFVCAMGTFLFSITTNLNLAQLFRFLTGIGSAFCFLSSIRLASRWFSSQRMALVSGLIVTMAMTGGMVAQAPLTHLVEYMGWRHALMIDATLGGIILSIIWYYVQDYPPGMEQYFAKHKQHLQMLGFWRSMATSYFKRQNWLCAFYTTLMNLPIALLGALWGILYLKEVHHLSANSASLITAMLFVGTIIGSPIAGWTSDKIGKRRPPMIIGALISLVIFCGIFYIHTESTLLLSLLFFALGLFTSTQVISYPLVAESNAPALTASSVSVISFTAMSSYAICQPLFGWLMDLRWDGLTIQNQPIYSIASFHTALLILPIGFVLALLTIFFMRETNCKPVKQ